MTGAPDGCAEAPPFVEATVVRVQAPSSAHAGDRAIVRADGTIEGFVGGMCAEESVRLYALEALGSGQPTLLRILPGAAEARREEGSVTVGNPCLSGGALEIFLAPRLPAPPLVVVGDTPIARALAELGAGAGFAVAAVAAGRPAPDAAGGALVVASHGRGEERALEAALAAEVPYVGLVASRRRGAAVLAALDVDAAARERVHTPAGLDIGARTPGEVAISILAEIVAGRGAPAGAGATGTTTGPVGRGAPAGAGATGTAIDPVCGMAVAPVDATPHLDAGGERVWFCSEHCRAAFSEQAAAGSAPAS